MAKKKKVLDKPHPWRECPYGEHLVRTHPLHVPPSKKNPIGSITTRHVHCAHNPSGLDQLYPFEIEEISNQHFLNLKKRPCPLPLKFSNGSKYDDLIAGWVQYWNEIFQPMEPLDSNLVKALIATESGFNPNMLSNKKKPNSARGLMQITNDTRKILSYVTATREELNNPSVNICAGTRWLFHKRKLASSKLGRQATWDEAIYNYKGCSIVSKKQAEKIMRRFREIYGDFKKCGKS